MELLDNIWIGLTTPNENIINFISIFLNYFIEIPLSLYLISTVFNLNPSKKQSIQYILINSTLGLISLMLIPQPYNTIFNYLVIFLVNYFIFKQSLIKTMIISLLPNVIFTLLGILLLNPYTKILNITREQATTIAIYKLPFSLIMYLLLFFIIFILKQNKININLHDAFDNKTKLLIVLNIILSVIYIIMQSIQAYKYTNILPLQYTFINFVYLLVYFSLSFCLICKLTKLVTTTQKLESAEAYNKTLHILHDSVRGFKHDFDNIVTTIGGYIQTNDMEGLKTYYSQLQNDCQKANNLYLLNPDIINNPGVYNLLTSKYNKAIDKNIKVNLTFLLDLNKLHMNIYEFARILGILLDNAIDAASECKEKILNITFRNEDKNHRNIIQIENTYKDKNVDLNNIFNKGVSGKKEHTGLGLWEIKQFLKKNNNINLYTSKTDKYFSQQLEIYYE